MAKRDRSDRVDPEWPQANDGEHAVSELVSDLQGAHSPFGDVRFPQSSVPYVHPETKINK
ncbi:hypothetical protein EV191_101517 [Tamaricihabitans halophyticus]|uniref:Uncharacterized protein n=1 Tax=Tamaricihabitans halophyticus TaxID=1262583 RepID=A0A4R2R3X1_9PSEU|nr:hypothetical protein [Tamaricihabitans halophyticus]TCP56574.1 hypothetical protein EV191_101517 [Tamaricihabitans halophyticus]